jgi:hypothetical protein
MVDQARSRKYKYDFLNIKRLLNNYIWKKNLQQITHELHLALAVKISLQQLSFESYNHMFYLVAERKMEKHQYHIGHFIILRKKKLSIKNFVIMQDSYIIIIGSYRGVRRRIS